jgi:hypothetical protein
MSRQSSALPAEPLIYVMNPGPGFCSHYLTDVTISYATRTVTGYLYTSITQTTKALLTFSFDDFGNGVYWDNLDD